MLLNDPTWENTEKRLILLQGLVDWVRQGFTVNGGHYSICIKHRIAADIDSKTSSDSLTSSCYSVSLDHSNLVSSEY